MGEVKILYIAGVGRSGSTLIGNILGQQDSFFNVGELHWIWRRGFLINELCGCYVPFRECTTWKKIIQSAFSNLEKRKLQTLINEWDVSNKTRRFLEYLLYPNIRKPTTARKYYLDSLQQLYQAIRETTGCRVIVDTSKSPTYGHLIDSLPNTKVYILHLVRDSRGVVFSLERMKVRPEDGKPMLQMNIWRSSALWLLWNAAIDLRWNRFDNNSRYIRLRYEDFIANPHRNLERIFSFIDEDIKVRNVDQNQVEIECTHTVSGNPSRFKRGVIDLRLDIDWKANMRLRDRILTLLITWPLLLRYGYFGDNPHSNAKDHT